MSYISGGGARAHAHQIWMIWQRNEAPILDSATKRMAVTHAGLWGRPAQATGPIVPVAFVVIYTVYTIRSNG